MIELDGHQPRVSHIVVMYISYWEKGVEVSYGLTKTVYSVTVKTLYPGIIKTKSFQARDLVGVHHIYIALCHKDDALAALNLSVIVLFQILL